MAARPGRLIEAGTTELEIVQLQHIKQSHHGTPEWGSSVGPTTMEAMIWHLADLASARLRPMLDIVERERTPRDGWCVSTGYRKEWMLTLVPAQDQGEPSSLAEEVDRAEW